MKNILITLIIIIGFTHARGQTNIGGLISTNTTWTLAGSPYLIISNTLIVSLR